MIKSNVLVVEDDSAVSETMKLALTMSGYDCHVCADGKEALTYLIENKPCLVLTDLLMPVMTGDELIKTMHDDVKLSALPIVIVTARKLTEDEFIGIAVIKKPFTLEELMECVDRHCGKGRNGSEDYLGR